MSNERTIAIRLRIITQDLKKDLDEAINKLTATVEQMQTLTHASEKATQAEAAHTDATKAAKDAQTELAKAQKTADPTQITAAKKKATAATKEETAAAREETKAQNELKAVIEEQTADLEKNQQASQNSAKVLTLAGAVVLKQAKNMVSAGIEYNALQQTTRAALTTLTGSAAAANAQMDRLDAFAKTSPFSKTTFITAQQQMLAFGIETKKVIPYLSALNDAVAAAGGSNQEIADLAYIMAQISAAGKITATDLMQFGQRGVNAAELIGSQMGKTGAQIRDEITAGALDANTALDALAAGMSEKFAGASTNVKDTWLGATDRLSAAWRDLSSEISELFVSKEGGGWLVGLVNSVASAIRAFQALPGPVKYTTLVLLAAGAAVMTVSSGISTLKPRINSLRLETGKLPASFKAAASAGTVLSLAIAAGIPILTAWQSLSAESEARVTSLAETMSTFGRITDETRKEIARLIAETKTKELWWDSFTLTEYVTQLGLDAKEIGRVLEEGEGAIDKYRDKVIQARNEIVQEANLLTVKGLSDPSATEAEVARLDELSRILRTTGNPEKIDNEFIPTLKTLSGDIEKASEKAIVMNQVLDGTSSASDSAASSLDGVGASTDQLGEDAQQTTTKLDALKAAILGVQMANLDYDTAITRLTRTNRDMVDGVQDNNAKMDENNAKIKENNKKVREGKMTAAEAAEENRKLKQSNVELKDSNEDLFTGAASDYQMVIQKMIDAKAPSSEIEAVTRQTAQAWRDAGKEAGYDADETQKLIDRYLAVPSEVKTQLLLQNGDSQEDIDVFKRALDDLPQTTKTSLIQTVEDEGLDAAVRRLKELNGKHFQTYVQINKIEKHNLAGGGSVVGPGTTTSDSIPAMLSNGEHVLTASDVDKLGGQGGVYRMRSLAQAGLLHFASGGAVKYPAGARLSWKGMSLPKTVPDDLDKIDKWLEKLESWSSTMQRWSDQRFYQQHDLQAKLDKTKSKSTKKSLQAQLDDIERKDYEQGKFQTAIGYFQDALNKKADELNAEADVMKQREEGMAERKKAEWESRKTKDSLMREMQYDLGVSKLAETITGGNGTSLLDKLRSWADDDTFSEQTREMLYTQAAANEDRIRKLTSELETAKTKVDELKSIYDSVYSNLNRFDISSLLDDEWLEQTNAAGTTWHVKGGKTAQDIAAAAAERAAQIQKFASLLGDLQRAGASPAVLAEIAALGSEKGIPVAELFKNDPAALQAMNGSYEQIANWSGVAAQYVTEASYAGGLSAAEGVVAGLEAQAAELAKTISNIFATAVNEVAGLSLYGTRASGGPIYTGMPYLVGETGPELVIPGNSGYVLTAAQTRSMLQSTTVNSGGNIYINGNMVGESSDLRKAVNDLVSAVSRAGRITRMGGI
jgi:tape measure domain-containing protein